LLLRCTQAKPRKLSRLIIIPYTNEAFLLNNRRKFPAYLQAKMVGQSSAKAWTLDSAPDTPIRKHKWRFGLQRNVLPFLRSSLCFVIICFAGTELICLFCHLGGNVHIVVVLFSLEICFDSSSPLKARRGRMRMVFPCNVCTLKPNLECPKTSRSSQRDPHTSIRAVSTMDYQNPIFIKISK